MCAVLVETKFKFVMTQIARFVKKQIICRLAVKYNPSLVLVHVY